MPTADRSGGSSKEKCSKSDLGNNSAAPQAPATPLLQPVITKDRRKKGRKNDELQPTNDENDEMTKQLGHPSPSTGNYLVTKRQKTKRQKKRQEGRPDKRQKDKMTKLETNPRQQKKCCSQPFRIYHCNCATLRRPQSRQLLIFILESGNQSIDQIYCTVYFIS